VGSPILPPQPVAREYSVGRARSTKHRGGPRIVQHMSRGCCIARWNGDRVLPTARIRSHRARAHVAVRRRFRTPACSRSQRVALSKAVAPAVVVDTHHWHSGDRVWSLVHCPSRTDSGTPARRRRPSQLTSATEPRKRREDQRDSLACLLVTHPAAPDSPPPFVPAVPPPQVPENQRRRVFLVGGRQGAVIFACIARRGPTPTAERKNPNRRREGRGSRCACRRGLRAVLQDQVENRVLADASLGSAAQWTRCPASSSKLRTASRMSASSSTTRMETGIMGLP
jgi:hypothetical protein